MTTDQKGAIAESAIVHAAIKLGIGVLKPLTDGHRYDLAFDLESGRLVRVQCKWAPLHGNVIVVRACSHRRTAMGLTRTSYSATEIDALAAYCPDLDRCFYLPGERVVDRTELLLRISPSRNNQRRGVNWADDFAFERLRFGAHGAVAQLGERRAGSAKARGSSPLGSIGAGGSSNL